MCLVVENKPLIVRQIGNSKNVILYMGDVNKKVEVRLKYKCKLRKKRKEKLAKKHHFVT